MQIKTNIFQFNLNTSVLLANCVTNLTTNIQSEATRQVSMVTKGPIRAQFTRPNSVTSPYDDSNVTSYLDLLRKKFKLQINLVGGRPGCKTEFVCDFPQVIKYLVK